LCPRKILGPGQSRTGTQSLRAALFELGYSDIYHRTSVLRQNPRDGEMWIEAFESKYHGKGRPFEKRGVSFFVGAMCDEFLFFIFLLLFLKVFFEEREYWSCNIQVSCIGLH
jgi:hypothetical protein